MTEWFGALSGGRRKGMAMNLWIRCGDGDNYNDFGIDFAAAVEYLQMLGVVAPLVRCTKYGVSAAGFTGQNYISLFWGDEAAQPEREVTDAEMAELNNRLVALSILRE
jgi:hypothetical protein